MKMVIALLVGLVGFSLVPGVLACGEKDIQFVDSLKNMDYQMEKSSCTKSFFPSNGEQFLVEKEKMQVTEHQAKHILEDYLEMEYGPEATITMGGTEIPGHEGHHHGHGNPQLSHGHLTWSFNVKVPGKMEGKAFPMFVDMENGNVYGVGCGLGAGAVVYTPVLADYPDTDYSDAAYHAGQNGGNVRIGKANIDIFSSLQQFFLELFGLH